MVNRKCRARLDENPDNSDIASKPSSPATLARPPNANCLTSIVGKTHDPPGVVSESASGDACPKIAVADTLHSVTSLPWTSVGNPDDARNVPRSEIARTSKCNTDHAIAVGPPAGTHDARAVVIALANTLTDGIYGDPLDAAIYNT